MTLEELQEIAEKDLKINDIELDIASLQTPQIHNKFLKFLTKFKLLLVRAEDEFRTIKRDKWEYYTGKSDPQVYILKPFHLKILKAADPEWQKANQKVKYLEAVVDFLDRSLRQISNRTFTIKNAIDWKRFTSGAV